MTILLPSASAVWPAQNRFEVVGTDMTAPVAASHIMAPEPPVASSNINTWPVRCSSKCTGGSGNDNGASHWPTAEGTPDPFTRATRVGVDVVSLPSMSRAGLLMVWAPAIHAQ